MYGFMVLVMMNKQMLNLYITQICVSHLVTDRVQQSFFCRKPSPGRGKVAAREASRRMRAQASSISP